MDKYGRDPHRGTTGLTSLCFLLQTHGPADICQNHNPTVRSYTWFSPDSSIWVRLDRIYLTPNISRTSKSRLIQFFPYLDHDGTSFEFLPPTHTETNPRLLQTEHVHPGRSSFTNSDKIFLVVLADPEARF